MWNEKPCVYLRLSALLQGIMKEVEISTLEPFSTWKNSIKMPRQEEDFLRALNPLSFWDTESFTRRVFHHTL